MGQFTSGNQRFCNQNSSVLSFTHVAHPNTLAFLDLELCHDNGAIYAKKILNLLQEIPVSNSCHHPRWVSNIPCSQFCRLRRNCTEKDTDYDIHGQLLSQKFLDKGYPTSLVDEAFENCHSLPTGSRIPLAPAAKQPTRFITHLHTKYKKKCKKS